VNSRRARALFLAALAVLLAASGCNLRDDGSSEEELPPELTDPIAEAQEAGVSIYWLGERFEAGGLVFVATGGDFEEDSKGALLQVFYQSDPNTGRNVGTDITSSNRVSFSEAVNAAVERPEDITHRSVSIQDRQAEFIETIVGRWTNQRVIVDMPEAVVDAEGAASVSLDGQQVNPLNDPDTLLAALEQLRPYPE
jgi:hypothetical protein